MERFFYDLRDAFKQIYRKIHFEMGEELYRYLGVIGAGGDETSGIDRFAEEVYIQKLAKYGKIISEEAGEVGEGEYTIILDPIDGSSNLLSSFPYYGSSIALKKGEKTVFSAVVNFANGEFFIKSDAFYKRGSIHSFTLQEVTPNPYAKIGIFEKAYANAKVVERLKEKRLKFRSPGAVALSLAYARYVKFVLFVGEARVFDIEAGLHQCQGLHIYQDERIILVCKELDIFKEIKTIVLKD